MQRIGYLFEHPTVSGAEGSALDLLEHLNRREFAVVPFAPAGGELARRLTALGLGARPWRIPRTSAEESDLIRRLRRDGIDHLHANTLQLGRLTGRLAASGGVSATTHVRAFGRLSARARANLSANRAVIAVSKAVRLHLLEQGLPPERIIVIYNGVSRPALEPAGIRRELGLPETALVVAWMGQFTVRKGLDVLITVAKRCVSHRDDVHVAVLGDVFGYKAENRALKAAIEAAAGSAPLRGRLHLLGWRRDAFAVLREASVLLHTARQEPLGRVLIEALAAGTPIVATRVGGTEEVTGPCGVLAERDDGPALASGVNELLGDPERRRKLAADGLERWRRLFSAARMAREVEDVWGGE